MKARVVGVVLASSVIFAVTLSACGGANPTDLFGPSASSSPTDPSPGSSGSSGANGTSTAHSPAGSSGGTDTNGSGGSGGSGGSSGSSGTSGKDAGTPAYKSPGIFCGDQPGGGGPLYCAASNLCCARDFGGDTMNISFACEASSGVAVCAAGQAIRCDDRTDCPTGQVCCGAFDQNQGYDAIQCAASCTTSPVPGLTPVRFCDANAPTDECAEIGKTCTPSGSLPGFHVCK